MNKEDQIIEMIADVAEQATQQNLDLKDELVREIHRLDGKIDTAEKSLRDEMRELRNENAVFHDEIINYLKRAEQERYFMSAHLKRYDEEILELQRVTGVVK